MHPVRLSVAEPWILGRIGATGVVERAQLIVVDHNTTAITAIIVIISEFQHVNGYCDWSGRFDPRFRLDHTAQSSGLFHDDNNAECAAMISFDYYY